MTDEPIFEIGLVMAGAVSAGAYSAGVIDFLIEALDAYETSRTTGRTPEGEVWSGPTHAIRVPIITGASAGGMTAAITALQVHTNFEHVASGVAQSGPPKNNRLYASWVDEIGIEALLETSDLTGGNKLRSVLCSAVLDEIVGRTLKLPADRTRAWIGRDHALTVLFTISNTGGVPYRFSLEGAAHDSDYRMLNHGDDLVSALAQNGDAFRAY